MAREQHEWTGASGEQYTYFICTRAEAEKWERGHKGNYILAKKVTLSLIPGGLGLDTYWAAVYIGEGDLGDRARDHKYSACINGEGATHFHCHKRNRDSKQDRLDEEVDLNDRYSPPCEGKGDD